MNQWRSSSLSHMVDKINANEITLPHKVPLICFSHLRWDFVFQRPQHLMTRAAHDRQVFYWEEPIYIDPIDAASGASLSMRVTPSGVNVVTPVLPSGIDHQIAIETQRALLNELLTRHRILNPLLWYYTPQALAFSRHLMQASIVYDCMDELSAFLGADPSLPILERDLLTRASVVFTGGFSLYEVKRQQHPNVHPFPSGVDLAHFHRARQSLPEPPDQQLIPHPRLGFYGVLDERLDQCLLTALAALRPDWQIILVGPVVKVDPAALPEAGNLHYLGAKAYHELPAYLAGWDVALMPFALNAATRFISPTKTPEYLAAGRPVVSTPIVDVVRHYGAVKAVGIASTAATFAAAIEAALQLAHEPEQWTNEIDELLAASDWDNVWQRMSLLIEQVEQPVQAIPDRIEALSV